MINDNDITSSVFDRVGKRMPYSVPEGFFSSLEANITSQIEADEKPTSAGFRFRWRAVAAAGVAAVALLSGAVWLLTDNTASSETESFESAFYSMSQEDQDAMLDIYAADVFMEDDFNQ